MQPSSQLRDIHPIQKMKRSGRLSIGYFQDVTAISNRLDVDLLLAVKDTSSHIENVSIMDTFISHYLNRLPLLMNHLWDGMLFFGSLVFLFLRKPSRQMYKVTSSLTILTSECISIATAAEQ